MYYKTETRKIVYFRNTLNAKNKKFVCFSFIL